MTKTPSAILSVRNLSLAFRKKGEETPIVKQASLDLIPGKTIALIGESGSGKTLLAKSLVDLVPPTLHIQGGEICWKGANLLATPAADKRRALRGKSIAFIFQEPLSSLNPSLKIGLQLTEALAEHTSLNITEQKAAALDMLAKVQIKDPASVMRAYPHELSGGMRQRVMIAAALILQPEVLIADEPTTALDMVVRDEILGLMTHLATTMGTAVLIISHDLGAVARLADTIAVMEKGVIVESGSKNILLSVAKHPYTQKLLAAIPQPNETLQANQPSAPPETPILAVKNLTVSFNRKGVFPWQKTAFKAVDDVNFQINPSETLAVIGESGSGKTTVARTIGGLQPASGGSITFGGGNKDAFSYARTGMLQYIFQDPAGALNPRFRIGRSIAESLLPLDLSPDERIARVKEALRQVGLPETTVDRFPHQLSGGQRQRICIARAIAPRPAFIIADEPVSALDLTVQKQVLDLFLALKKEMQFACLFISHDLGVVEHIADRVGVLLQGKLVEIGPTDQIFNNPQHPYTRQLLAATPYLKKSPAGYELARRYHPSVA